MRLEMMLFWISCEPPKIEPALPPSQPRTVGQLVRAEILALPAEALGAHDLERQLGAVLSGPSCWRSS